MCCPAPIGLVAPDSAGMRLISAVGHLKDVCSSTVSKVYLYCYVSPIMITPPPTHTYTYTMCMYTHTHTHTHQVADALTTAGEHRKALDQAEKIEQEFITLMTGQGKEKPALHEERQMVYSH